MKSRASKNAEAFDVTEFLRPDDTDLRSALASLMGPDRSTLPSPNVTPGPDLVPGPNLTPGANLIPDLELRPGADLTPAPAVRGKRQYQLRRAMSTEEGHSRGEQDIYLTLLRESEPLPDSTGRLRIGMLGLARLAGMSESNARINIRGLVQKLAVEEETSYACEQGQGRTWRVYPPEQVLERRRAAGMEWYRKRTLAVVFSQGPEPD